MVACSANGLDVLNDAKIRQNGKLKQLPDHFFDALWMMDRDGFVVICQWVIGPIKKAR